MQRIAPSLQSSMRRPAAPQGRCAESLPAAESRTAMEDVDADYSNGVLGAEVAHPLSLQQGEVGKVATKLRGRPAFRSCGCSPEDHRGHRHSSDSTCASAGAYCISWVPRPSFLPRPPLQHASSCHHGVSDVEGSKRDSAQKRITLH